MSSEENDARDEFEEVTEQKELTPIERIEQCSSEKRIPFYSEEWGLHLELREPKQGKTSGAARFYSKKDRNGKDRSDELDYAIVAMCVYHDGKPLFENRKQAQKVLEKQGVRTAHLLIKAVQIFCMPEEGATTESEIEAAEND